MSLDDYAHHLIATLVNCARHCFPCHSSPSFRLLVGWNDGSAKLKEGANFWYKVWEQAGCPASGALFDIKNKKYKYSVRRLKCRQWHLLHQKLACSFSAKGFWSVRQLNRPSPSAHAPGR
jgi:hypothetical protein